jgi:HEAT repeat protein
VDDALVFLRDTGNAARQRSGAEWLNTAPVDEARKAEVARGLGALLDSPATRDAALTSLKKWATKDSVPGLVKLVDDPDRGTAFRAMELVGKLDDERAAPPLVKALAAFDRAGPARSALEALGKKAEKEVLKNLHSPNGQVRNHVRDLLRAWNVPDAVIFDQTLEDVNASDAQARVAALDDLGKRKRDDDKADKVAKALDTALQDRELSVRRASVRVLGEWGTKDNVPALLKLLDDRQMVGDVVPVLGKLKDPAAAAPLVKLLYDFGQRGRASKALQDIGKDVEGEVLKELNSKDGGVRREVHNILRAVGTVRSVPALQTAILATRKIQRFGRTTRIVTDPNVTRECTQTIQAVQGRN